MARFLSFLTRMIENPNRVEQIHEGGHIRGNRNAAPSDDIKSKRKFLYMKGDTFVRKNVT